MCVAGMLAPLLVSPAARAVTYPPREDSGVAGIDPVTGRVLWEAWRERDLPEHADDSIVQVARAIFQSPYGAWQWSDPVDDGVRAAPRSVAPSGPRGDFIVREDRRRLELRRVGPGGREPIGVFPIESAVRKRVRLGPVLVVQLDQGRLLGMPLAEPEGEWTPAWRFDAYEHSDRPRHERTARLVPAGDEVLFVTHERWVLIDARGRVRRDQAIADPWPRPDPLDWGGRYPFGVDATVTDHRIFVRHGRGVILFDRTSGRELARHHTHFFYLPIVRPFDDVVLVQIGSGMPTPLATYIRRQPDWRDPLNLSRLGPQDMHKRVAATRALHAYGERYPLEKIESWLDTVGDGSPDDEQAAARITRGLLATWPRRRDLASLVRACVDALARGPGDGDAAPPLGESAETRLMHWATLRELSLGQAFAGPDRYLDSSREERILTVPNDTLKVLVDEAWRVVEHGPEPEREFAAFVLAAEHLGRRLLDEEAFAALALSEHEAVWPWAAAALVRSGLRDELVGIAWRRPEADHGLIARFLRRDIAADDMSAEEVRFWTHRAEQSPLDTARVMTTTYIGPVPQRYVSTIPRRPDPQRPLPPSLYAPIRVHLEQEAAEPTVVRRGGWFSLLPALWLLDAFEREADTPLLRRYLAHPQYLTRAKMVGLCAWGQVFRPK